MAGATDTELPHTVENTPPTPGGTPQNLGLAHLSESERQHIVLGIEATKLALTVPPPEVIKGYLEFYPDAAQKFFTWSEEESHHRREMDKILITSQVEDSRRGINYGLLVSLAGLVLAGFAVYMHEPWAASIVGGGTIVSLARAFIVGKNLFQPRSKKL